MASQTAGGVVLGHGSPLLGHRFPCGSDGEGLIYLMGSKDVQECLKLLHV